MKKNDIEKIRKSVIDGALENMSPPDGLCYADIYQMIEEAKELKKMAFNAIKKDRQQLYMQYEKLARLIVFLYQSLPQATNEATDSKTDIEQAIKILFG